MDIDIFIRFVIIFLILSLFTVAAYLFLSGQWKGGTSAMLFVVILVFVLTISKYKQFRFFNVLEAEMWSEKQEQAAKVIDRMEVLSLATSKQLALLTSKLGLWDAGLTNPETADLLENVRKILETTPTTKQERENTLAPLYWRIHLNYVGAAYQMIDSALKRAREQLESPRRSDDAGVAQNARDRIQRIEGAIQKVRSSYSVKTMTEQKSIKPLLEFVRNSPLSSDEALLKELNEIEIDMQYFDANGQLRRRIDWRYLSE